MHSLLRVRIRRALGQWRIRNGVPRMLQGQRGCHQAVVLGQHDATRSRAKGLGQGSRIVQTLEAQKTSYIHRSLPGDSAPLLGDRVHAWRFSPPSASRAAAKTTVVARNKHVHAIGRWSEVPTLAEPHRRSSRLEDSECCSRLELELEVVRLRPHRVDGAHTHHEAEQWRFSSLHGSRALRLQDEDYREGRSLVDGLHLHRDLWRDATL
mmetsp:Transcript_83432/g.131790  ORF Transcript_83432/g.131790 Transcript_83432/m.131790 type:complete len:209 (-) Transcript_83432:401-1027(-)